MIAQAAAFAACLIRFGSNPQSDSDAMSSAAAPETIGTMQG